MRTFAVAALLVLAAFAASGCHRHHGYYHHGHHYGHHYGYHAPPPPAHVHFEYHHH